AASSPTLVHGTGTRAMAPALLKKIMQLPKAIAHVRPAATSHARQLPGGTVLRRRATPHAKGHASAESPPVSMPKGCATIEAAQARAKSEIRRRLGASRARQPSSRLAKNKAVETSCGHTP